MWPYTNEELNMTNGAEGNLGKALGKMVRDEVQGRTRNGVPTKPERTAASNVPKQGDRVILLKRSINAGQESQGIQPGNLLEGIMISDLALGQSIRLDNGGQTSAIQAMRLEGDKVVVETQTSTYEVSRT
jgi:hypothetical protein